MARTKFTARKTTNSLPRDHPFARGPPPSPSPAPSTSLLYPGLTPQYSPPSSPDEVEPQSSSSATSPLHTCTSSSSASSPSPTKYLDVDSPIQPRTRKLNNIYDATAFAASLALSQDPIEDHEILEDHCGPTIEEALMSPEHELWDAAIQEELSAHDQSRTWALVPRPHGVHVIGSKWLLKKKFLPDGSVERYKARLVARGFTQQHGIDYNDTYSPVLGMASFRTLVALAAAYNLPLHHVDIKTAFLHGHLDEEVYMYQPPFFHSTQFPNHVCQLRRPIYGLKQSPRQWYVRMHNFLCSWGWERLVTDNNIFIWRQVDGICILGLFVDDIPIIASDELLVQKAIDMLASEFPISDKGPMSYFLGIEVRRDPKGEFITLSQTHYIREILKQHHMSSCTSANTPIVPASKLAPEYHPYSAEDAHFMHDFPYNRLLGKIRYLITCTRLDLTFAGHILSRALQSPRKVHGIAAKRTLRYLNCAQNYALTYHFQGNPLSFKVFAW